MKKFIPVFLILTAAALNACGLNDVCDYTEAPAVLIQYGGGNFYIDAYEASRGNATNITAGNGLTLACNYEGTIPWSSVTYEDAYNACLDAGKRLCTRDEWSTACAANYPYGNIYDQKTCNDGGLEIFVTGGFAQCKTASGIYDMSGNLREWVEGGILMGGSYLSGPVDLTCNSAQKISDYLTFSPTEADGFRCCKDESISGGLF